MLLLAGAACACALGAAGQQRFARLAVVVVVVVKLASAARSDNNNRRLLISADARALPPPPPAPGRWGGARSASLGRSISAARAKRNEMKRLFCELAESLFIFALFIARARRSFSANLRRRRVVVGVVVGENQAASCARGQ